MTREQAKNNLIGFGIEAPTDEQITNYLNQVNGESKKERDRANAYKADAERVTELEKKIEEMEGEKLSDTEKIQKELDKMTKLLAEKDAEIYRSKVVAEFKKEGYDIEEFGTVIDAFVTMGAEAEAKASAFVSALTKKNKSNLDEAKKEWEAEKLKGTPAPDGDPGVKEDDDPSVAFAKKLAKENAVEENKTVLDYYM